MICLSFQAMKDEDEEVEEQKTTFGWNQALLKKGHQDVYISLPGQTSIEEKEHINTYSEQKPLVEQQTTEKKHWYVWNFWELNHFSPV